MIVTNRFVFIHLHRTGGQFIRSLLFKHFPEAREIGYHFPLSLLPRIYQEHPVIGFVRDPVDWYRSWYAFNKPKPRSPIFAFASDDGRLGFEQTVCNMLFLGAGDAGSLSLKTRMVEALPNSILGNRGAGITRQDLAAFNDDHIGYYSWLVRRMYAGQFDSPRLHLGRFERLHDELLRLLTRVGGGSSADLVRDIMETPAINACREIEKVTTISNEIMQLITERERWLPGLSEDYRFGVNAP